MQPHSKQTMMSRRTFLKASLAVGIPVAGATTVYGTRIEPFNLEITERRIPLQSLPATFENYKIIHITDLHYGSWLDKDWFTEVNILINSQEPDLVAITGDFTSLGDVAPHADDLIEILSAIQATDGVVAVLGNHDHWANVEQIREVLQAANVTELPNTSIVIERNGEAITIAGLDDVWFEKHDMPELSSTLPDDTPRILLVHEPDIADTVAKLGQFALQLSGHTHGGQIRLPLIGAPYLPHLGRLYPIGHYKIRDMQLYTNRGIGMVDLPIRINCRPEVAVFTLTSDSKA